MDGARLILPEYERHLTGTQANTAGMKSPYTSKIYVSVEYSLSKILFVPQWTLCRGERGPIEATAGLLRHREFNELPPGNVLERRLLRTMNVLSSLFPF